MNIIGRVRQSLNITSAGYDEELKDVVAAARHDMVMSGVPPWIAENDGVSGVRQAIKCYVKADQSWETPDIAAKQMESYRSIVDKLALTYGHQEGGGDDGDCLA